MQGTPLLKTILISILFLGALPETFSQYFGGNPPSLKWKRFDSDTVRVVFPEILLDKASRISDISHYLNQKTTSTLGRTTRKISIILQPLPIVSNAYVGLAPWRSEFFMMPPQNSMWLGGMPWSEMLALHEYRHVQQYMNFRKGMSRFAWMIAGEQGQALANSMSVPDWFFEGDAVWQESALSQQGRGRLPEFFNGYRSLWNEGKKYSYMKLRNGSMKDFVPNHYQLGYLLVAKGHERFGVDVWSKVTDRAVRFKPVAYPFQGAFRAVTGHSFKSFAMTTLSGNDSTRAATMDSLGGRWVSTVDKRNVVEEHLPYILGEDSILFLRQTYRDIPAWYISGSKGQRRVAVKDIGIDDYYTYANGIIAYSTYRPDTRWGWRQYSDVVVLSLADGQRKLLTRHARYFSPGLSHDVGKIVAVHVGLDGSSSLHILDAASGKVLHQLGNPEGYFHTYPVFSADDTEIITAVRNAKGEMALLAFHARNDTARIIVPFGYTPIAFPRVRGNHVVFTASAGGRDKIMAVHAGSGKIIELASHQTGMYGADIDTERNLLYAPVFTASGQRIRRLPLTDAMDSQVEFGKILEPLVPMAMSNMASTLTDSIAPVQRTVEKHPRHAGLLNFHSWRPFYEQPDWTFSVYGENVINTFRSELYHQYNENEGFNKTGANLRFGGLLPVIIAGASFTGGRNTQLPASGTVPATQVRWDEWNMNVGWQLPLNLTGGRQFRYLTVASSYNHQQVRYTETGPYKIQDRSVSFLQTSFSWSSQSQQAYQHIHPRFAQAVNLRSRVGIGSTAANQFLANAALYFPGIMKNHSLVMTAAYQARDTMRQYVFSNSFPLSRGYPGVDYPHMWKWGANYHFTLAYPDLGFAQLVYLMRIRANVFYDISWVRSLRQQRTWALQSLGTEIYFDTKWWNQLPVSLGVRYSRLLDTDIYQRRPRLNQFEFVIPVDLIPGGSTSKKSKF